jgi:hypothetical protein
VLQHGHALFQILKKVKMYWEKLKNNFLVKNPWGKFVLKDGMPPLWPIELKCGAIWDISRNSLGEPLKNLMGTKKNNQNIQHPPKRKFLLSLLVCMLHHLIG